MPSRRTPSLRVRRELFRRGTPGGLWPLLLCAVLATLWPSLAWAHVEKGRAEGLLAGLHHPPEPLVSVTEIRVATSIVASLLNNRRATPRPGFRTM